MARNEEPVRRLATIPGIGTINATALAAAVGNARAFRRGRDMAAWLGLTPRQTTGGKPRLLGISKRGNRYLRNNLIHGAHGARAVLDCWRGRTRMLSLLRWLTSWRALPWVVLARGGVYDAGYEAAAA
jgi:transposase